MILAEVQLSWSAFGGVLGAIVLILTVLEKARKALGAAPEKREVKFADEFVTKPEFSQLKATVEWHEKNGEARREKIYTMMKEIRESTDTKLDEFRREVKADVEGVHGRVSDLVQSVGEIRGEIKQALNSPQRNREHF